MLQAADLDLKLYLPSSEATAALGQALADRLRPGDTVLLSGPIGAGKTHLARSLIQSWLGSTEDVPSPSFTLVQTYGEAAELWHADLYRLGHPDEVLELGLEDAIGQAIVLIEWPDRLGELAPKEALRLEFSLSGEGRQLHVAGPAAWADRLSGLGGTIG